MSLFVIDPNRNHPWLDARMAMPRWHLERRCFDASGYNNANIIITHVGLSANSYGRCMLQKLWVVNG